VTSMAPPAATTVEVAFDDDVVADENIISSVF
jgi:hypothetical protein